MKLVKLLFSSSDMPEVAFVKSVLVRAGIRCEIRHQDTPAATPETPVYPALWIQDEADFLTISMLFASGRRRHAPSVSIMRDNAWKVRRKESNRVKWSGR